MTRVLIFDSIIVVLRIHFAALLLAHCMLKRVRLIIILEVIITNLRNGSVWHEPRLRWRLFRNGLLTHKKTYVHFSFILIRYNQIQVHLRVSLSSFRLLTARGRPGSSRELLVMQRRNNKQLQHCPSLTPSHHHDRPWRCSSRTQRESSDICWCEWVGNEKWTVGSDWSSRKELVDQGSREWEVDGKFAGKTRSVKGLIDLCYD